MVFLRREILIPQCILWLPLHLRSTYMLSTLRDPHLTRNIAFILWRLFIFDIEQPIVGWIQMKQLVLVVVLTKKINCGLKLQLVIYQHRLASLNLERSTLSWNTTSMRNSHKPEKSTFEWELAFIFWKAIILNIKQLIIGWIQLKPVQAEIVKYNITYSHLLLFKFFKTGRVYAHIYIHTYIYIIYIHIYIIYT